MIVQLPKQTSLNLGAVTAVLVKDTDIELPVEELGHAAELLSASGVQVDLSYTENRNGRQIKVYFGPGGKMREMDVTPEAAPKKVAKPKASVKKAAPKKKK